MERRADKAPTAINIMQAAAGVPIKWTKPPSQNLNFLPSQAIQKETRRCPTWTFLTQT